MRTSVRVLFLLLICWIGSTTLALSQKKEGDKYFEKGQYAEALKNYNAYTKIGKRENTLIRRAICHYHLGNTTKCLFDLNVAERLGSDSKEIYEYRAKTFHALAKYPEAAEQYKKYLASLKDDSEERKYIVDLIRQCGYARNFILKEPIAFTTNLGPQINTKSKELRLVESVNFPNKIYFTSDRFVETQIDSLSEDDNAVAINSQNIFTSIFGYGLPSDQA